MKKLITLLLFLSPFWLGAQDMECSEFRKGTFILTDVADQSGTRRIVRKKKKQIEYIKQAGKKPYKIILGIKWESECSYTLTFIKASDGSMEALKGQSMTFVIEEINGSFYKARLSVDGKMEKDFTEMKKIR